MNLAIPAREYATVVLVVQLPSHEKLLWRIVGHAISLLFNLGAA
jgi:hypothetical protein